MKVEHKCWGEILVDYSLIFWWIIRSFEKDEILPS